MTNGLSKVPGRRSIPRWVKTAIIVVAIGAIVLVFGIVRSSRNTARSDADWIPTFADSTGAIAYCANGYGKGIDNNVPWWDGPFSPKGRRVALQRSCPRLLQQTALT